MNEEEIRRLELEAEAEAEAEYEYSQLQKQSAGPPGQPDESASAIVGGLSKGYLKNVASAVTAPADLAFRGLNWAADKVGLSPGISSEDMPSNMVARGVDWLAEGVPSNPTAERVGGGLGAVASLANAPSAIPKVLTATKGMSIIPRAIVSAGTGAAEGAGWGAALAAKNSNADLGDAAIEGGVVGGIVGGAMPVAEVAANRLRDSSFARLMGYNPEGKAKVEAGLDANGAITQDASQAVQQVSKKDIQLKNLRDSGFTNTLKATDSPEQVSLKLWQFQQNAGKTIGDTIDQALPLEQSIMSNPQLAPWQKFEIANAPKFEDADEFVRSVMQSDPVSAATLQTRLDSIRDAWNSSGQTLADFKQMQQNLGVTGRNSYAAGKSTADGFNDTLNNLMYGDIAQSLAGRVQKIGEAAGDPALGARFSEANKAYSSATTFKDSAFTASRQAVSSKLAEALNPFQAKGLLRTTLNAAGPIAEAVAPVATMKSADAVSSLMALANKVPLGNSIVGGILSRDWEDVKSNPQSMAALATKAGIPIDTLSSMPEPVQMSLHEQVVSLDPASATPVPGNYSVVNGRFLNPMEKDVFVRQHLDADAKTRAMVVGASFQNKYMPPPPEMAPPPMAPRALPSVMEKVSRWSREPLSQLAPMATGSTDMLSQMEELTRNKLDHAQDR